MGVTLEVPYDVLRTAKEEWDLAADTLDGGWRRLSRVSTGDLAPTVAAAVARFRETWVEELRACGGQAQRFSDAFVDTGSDFLVTDVTQAELMRSVLPWAYRAAPIDAGDRPW